MDKRLFVLIGLSLIGGIGLTQLPRLDALPQQMWTANRTADAPVTDPGVTRVMQQVAELERRLEDSRAEVDRLRKRQLRMSELGMVIEDLECRLAETHSQLVDDQYRALTEASLRDDVEARLDERIAALNEGIESRWTDLQAAVFETQSLAEAASGTVDAFRQREAPDRERMWAELMGPTVQLAGDSTVGSGVLLRSRELADGTHRTHLLTAWHVVRDILSDADGLERPIPVTLYSPQGEVSHDTATLLEFDPTLDVALLVMDSSEAYAYGANLPQVERLQHAGVFDPIYAVGCPLGNDPIPTYGEVADTEHRVGDEAYWMISAPTYIGNSGGGIFDAKTHELLGIFSKIYTHGNLRPTVVPHMGLVTPMDRIYAWLGEVGYAELEPQQATSRPLTASADR
jgi:S1-C subfamily serine protease